MARGRSTDAQAQLSAGVQHGAVLKAAARLDFGEVLSAAGVNGPVRVWRGVPRYAEDHLRPGDLVTIDPEMAWAYASRRGKLIEADVDASLLTYYQRANPHEVELRYIGQRPTGHVVRIGP